MAFSYVAMLHTLEYALWLYYDGRVALTMSFIMVYTC